MSIALSSSQGIDANAIPSDLRELDQWVVWREEKRGGKPTKVPYNPHGGRKASSTDSTTWTTFKNAIEVFQRSSGRYNGIGFVFSPDDPFAGVDLDGCIDENGHVERWAEEIISRVNTYTEISPSGRGVKLLLRGKVPGRRKRSGRIEMYDKSRYFTVTAQHLKGTPTTVEDRGGELADLYHQVFKEDKQSAAIRLVWPKSEPGDDGIIAKVASSPRWADLWRGDIDGYPSASEADLALCGRIAFFAGADHDWIDRIFRQSALCRDKWTQREDYRQATIVRALDGMTSFYDWPDNGDGAWHSVAPNGSPPQATSSERFRLTDLGNAERFAEQHGENLQFCGPLGKWFYWSGKQWEEDRSGVVQRLAKKTVRSMYVEAGRIEDDKAREVLIRHAGKSESRERIRAMIELAKSESGIPILPEEFDSDRWLFNCQNGTVDLRSGRLLPHDRDHLLTKRAPVEYDSNAEATLWQDFLQTIMDGNGQLIGYLQRLAGVFLTGDISEQILPIFWGVGANGKSVFLDTMLGIMGQYACPAPDSLITTQRHEEHPTEIAGLRGKRLVIASETEQGKRLRVNLVKKLTGDKFLTGRFMRQDYFTFERTHTTVLVTNNKPVVRETDKAIWRRIRLVPFTITIPEQEQDKQLVEKLRAEWPGILRWAVVGCVAWQRDGLGEPPDVAEATDSYRREQDPLTEFLADRCVLSASAKVSRSSLWVAYQEWTKDTGEKYPLRRADLIAGIDRLEGVRPAQITEHGRRLRGWMGIGLACSQPVDSARDDDSAEFGFDVGSDRRLECFRR